MLNNPKEYPKCTEICDLFKEFHIKSQFENAYINNRFINGLRSVLPENKRLELCMSSVDVVVLRVFRYFGNILVKKKTDPKRSNTNSSIGCRFDNQSAQNVRKILQ